MVYIWGSGLIDKSTNGLAAAFKIRIRKGSGFTGSCLWVQNRIRIKDLGRKNLPTPKREVSSFQVLNVLFGRLEPKNQIYYNFWSKQIGFIANCKIWQILVIKNLDRDPDTGPGFNEKPFWDTQLVSDLLYWGEEMVASAPELAQHRTILRNCGEHGHGHCVADQGQARQQTTPHCKEQICPGFIIKRGKWQIRIQRRENPWEELLRNGLVQITLVGFFETYRTAQDGTGSVGREQGCGSVFIFYGSGSGSSGSVWRPIRIRIQIRLRIQYGSRALMTKNWKKITAENFLKFFFDQKLQFTYP